MVAEVQRHDAVRPNGIELSGAADLLHLILALRLRPLQRIVRQKLSLALSVCAEVPGLLPSQDISRADRSQAVGQIGSLRELAGLRPPLLTAADVVLRGSPRTACHRTPRSHLPSPDSRQTVRGCRSEDISKCDRLELVRPFSDHWHIWLSASPLQEQPAMIVARRSR